MYAGGFQFNILKSCFKNQFVDAVGGSENYQIRRATIFSDLARPFNLGGHGDDRADVGEVLTEFLIHEIGSKSVDGITYAMITKDKKDEATYKKYVEIRKEGH